MRRPVIRASLLFAGLLGALGALPAFPPEVETPPQKPYGPKVFPASDEGLKAIRRIRVPDGLKVELFAAEPLLANPVSFCIDEKGRFYVAETFRLHAGVTDNRGHMNWLDDDLASRTVADRVALYKKYLGKNFAGYTREHDRIRLIEDTDGDGVADRSTVFADGFHNAEDGIGAGVLAHGGNVWYTCIPDLWRLRDTRGTGKADERQRLSSGYGVHVSFLGHDLHGLRFGPDGKLYFSCGDRGLNVVTEGRTVSCPDTGAVLRCNPDGSELELVATGLRNPQELAFDQYGNLFTGDNNADHGDAARWVYVVEGGDSGWRVGYQYMQRPVALGPFSAEKLWHLPHEGQAAYIVPPIAHIANGPSGLTYFPGTGRLPARYLENFFLCDFRGSSGGSGIHAFAVKPKGASFELVDRHQFVWSILATDCDFGPDGAFYLSDWVEGWNKTGKGRIYRVHDPARANDPVVAEVKKLLAEGMARRSLTELARLLEHADMRVRQEAQFTLAARGAEAMPVLAKVSKANPSRLARLNALWGLGQLGRKLPAALAPVRALTADADAEVRAQAAKVLGQDHDTAAAHALVELLKDAEPRVRFFAALSLGKLGAAEAVPALLEMARMNGDQDAYLRHAAVMGLTGANDRKALLAAAADPAPAVRMAVLLAMRRLEMPEVGRFLADADSKLVVEAARAINDVPIPAALPQLAALVGRAGLADPVLYRVLNAHFRLGKDENAMALAAFAARPDAPAAVRVEALRSLGEWAAPPGRDHVVGLWRPLAPRPAEQAAQALRPALGGIFSGPDRVREEGARVAARFGMKEIGPLLMEMIADKDRPARVRVETLKALEALKDRRLPEAMQLALDATDARVRTQGRRILVNLEPARAMTALETALERGDVRDRQGALAILGEMKGPDADAPLARWLDRLLARQVPPEIQLDLLEAAAQRSAPAVKQKLAKYEATRSKTDPFASYREALLGGDADAGRRVFFEKSEVSCVRCHKIKGEGGEVGPDLTSVGAKQQRPYLLESIVDPNKQIAQGFETVVLQLTNGQVKTGVLKSEDAREVRLMTAEGQLIVVPTAQIDERARGKSAMPQDIVRHLTRSEVRDLVEFLATLK